MDRLIRWHVPSRPNDRPTGIIVVFETSPIDDRFNEHAVYVVFGKADARHICDQLAHEGHIELIAINRLRGDISASSLPDVSGRSPRRLGGASAEKLNHLLFLADLTTLVRRQAPSASKTRFTSIVVTACTNHLGVRESVLVTREGGGSPQEARLFLQSATAVEYIRRLPTRSRLKERHILAVETHPFNWPGEPILFSGSVAQMLCSAARMSPHRLGILRLLARALKP